MHFPQHIGIIPDGNRTRAKKNGYKAIQGHLEGVAKSKKIIKHIFTNTEIKVLTLRWLSTENARKRPPEEYSYLMNIFLDHTIDNELNEFLRTNRINYRRLGNPTGIHNELTKSLHKKMQEHDYPESNRTICIAINYGWRDEIIRAIQTYNTQGYDMTNISEQDITNRLDTHDLPDLDLIIRTKAHHAQRLSGFMAWQAAYAELYFSEKLFPDFDTDALDNALERFNDIATYRNFGQ